MQRTQYKWALPKEIQARLGNESWGAQRALFEVGHLLLVLHAPPRKERDEREHEVFLRHPDGKWLYKGAERGEAALSNYLEDYHKLYAALETRFEKAQDVMVLFQIIDDLIPLARSSTNMSKAFQAAREQVGDDAFLITMRDRANDIARAFELLLADARLALEFRRALSAEIQAKAAESQARAQHKLNILAAITFPLMCIATVFGMNLHSGLEDLPVIAFWLVFGGGLAIGLGVKGWVETVKQAPRPSAKRTKD